MKAIVVSLCLLLLAGAAWAGPRHSIAMLGEPLHRDGPDHFAYADPAAPKGGTLRLGVLGSFDSLNAFIVTGAPANAPPGGVFETLMTRAGDEPFSLYAGLAESLETPDDRSYVEFQLDPRARFSDGRPVGPEDVIFSMELLREHGRANYRTYYKKIARAERVGSRGVRFTFQQGADRELPLIMGLMPVLPAHAYDPATFERPSLAKPVGSGPYLVEAVDPGRSVTYRRDPGYWGRDLPVNRGRFNFDRITYGYYLDPTALLEGFFAGEFDVLVETDPQQWRAAYDVAPVRDGRIVREELPVGLPAGMTALVFNQRRAIFADARVRRALIRLFDFEWINRSLYGGAYMRTRSFFERSALSSAGVQAGERERALLAPFPGAVDPVIMEGGSHLPVSDGRGWNRENLKAALDLLAEAGWRLEQGRLVRAGTGTPFVIEVLSLNRNQERLFLAYGEALKRAGIKLDIRQVDPAEYQRRLSAFDFDMVQGFWPASLSPGNEQLFRWSSAAADNPGAFNLAGIRSPAIDAVIEQLLRARTPEDLEARTRALDRLLLSGDYVLPLFHLPRIWLARWRHIRHPDLAPLAGYALETWWAEGAGGIAGP